MDFHDRRLDGYSRQRLDGVSEALNQADPVSRTYGLVSDDETETLPPEQSGDDRPAWADYRTIGDQRLRRNRVHRHNGRGLR